MIGNVFGKWTVLRFDKVVGTSKYYECLCACGRMSSVRATELKAGRSKSCGCFKASLLSKANKIHGKIKTPEYYSWRGAKSRCYNTSNKSYSSYGGRGIKMSQEWLVSFEQFHNDMGDKPSAKHSLDRIDNNGNYCKDNCRWATNNIQSNNKRGINKIKYKNKTYSISALSILLSINRNTLSRWIKDRGLSVEECIERNKQLKDKRAIN